MSNRMGKPTIFIGKNKATDQLCSNCTADQRPCFRYTDSTIPPLLIPKFQASSLLLWLYRPICIRRDRKPKLLVSHAQAQMESCNAGKTNIKQSILTEYILPSLIFSFVE